MDLWAVGAAAAAGYAAKHWKNTSKDKDGLSESSSGASQYEKSEAMSHLFHRLTPRKKLAEEVSTNMCILDSASGAEEVSSSGHCENTGSLRNYDDCNVLSLSSLPLGISSIQNRKENEDKSPLSGCMAGDPSERCMRQRHSFDGSGRSKTSLRTKRLCDHYIKPLSSLDSCLMAQLYKEHTEMQEYMLSALPSPSTTMRPLLVTDGKQILSRVNSDSSSAWTGTDNNGLLKEDNVCGFSPLPKIRNLDLSEKIKSKTGKGNNERLSRAYKTGSEKHFHFPNGSDEGIVLFCFGISIGIVSSLIANKSEVDKLKQLLKHTENLVQDLQEELEMKDLLTVKELANENLESQDTCQSSCHNGAPIFPVQIVDNSTDNNVEKADESSECMSKIEAELEAELERLGLNMQTSSLEGRLSDLVEVDPDFVADFAQGELRADRINGCDATQSESNQDVSTSTTQSVNYAVSPRELSLRLHQVIQSRLEERVKELEAALQNSQSKVQLLESEQNNVLSNLSSNELRYSSNQKRPIAKGYSNPTTEPLVMNLSGEALDAYNEAYKELMKMNESEEENSPSGICESNYQEGIHPFDCRVSCAHNCGANDSVPHLMHNIENTPKESFISQFSTFVEKGSRIQELIYDSVSDDESNDCDDEVEKQLIKQIVEQTKKGSPAVLNAERVFFSMDENEH